MTWLLKVDVGLFRWINDGWSNAFFDWLMPFLSGNRLFVPALLLLVGWSLVKGSRRLRVCIVLAAIAVGIGDGLVSNPIKKAVDRPRPFLELDNVRLRVGRGESASPAPGSLKRHNFEQTEIVEEAMDAASKPQPRMRLVARKKR